MSLHDLLIVAVVLYAALFALYLGRAALAPWIGRLLCRLGLHEVRARRTDGYWVFCARSCGYIASRADRRHQA